MTTTDHDAAALAHYTALIAQHYPPQLAALLAAARYAHGLAVTDAPLPAVMDAVEALGRGNATIHRHARAIRSHLEDSVGAPTLPRAKRAS